MNLRCILVNERNQSEKAAYFIIPIIRHSEKGKITGIVKRLLVAHDSGKEKGWICEAQGILWGSETILYNTLIRNAWRYAFVKTHRANLMYVNFKKKLFRRLGVLGWKAECDKKKKNLTLTRYETTSLKVVGKSCRPK